MQQLDFFDKNAEFYLHSEHQKLKTTVDKLRGSLFSHVSELHTELLDLKKEMFRLRETNANPVQ